MSLKLSQRIGRIKPSPTLAITAKAKALKAQGMDIVGFGAGEPDFDTPDIIKNAAKKAMDEGFTKYTEVGGIQPLKEAIIKKFERDNNISYKPNEILVSCGGKQTFFNWALAVLDTGDEVIIPAPYWVSYPDMVCAADGTPVIVETDESTGFRMTAAQLKKAITPKTRAVVINSPSNPTGMGYTEAELRALAAVLDGYPNIQILSDEIYEKIIYRDFKHVSIASFSPSLKARTFTLNGVSKTYSMTGWRIGYIAGDKDVIEAMNTIQGQSTSNPCSISQKASVMALNMDQAPVEEMRRAFDERRAYIVGRLNKIPGVKCLDPDGAFYAFPNVSHYYPYRAGGQPIKDSEGLSTYLLEKANIAVVPGWGFGGHGCIRLSYAISMEQIKKGIDRLEEALGKLEKP